jgi:glycosyltransferase involved in cell wall biosynthesis
MAALSRCRFAVLPSICPETCPMVAREAMSRGKALIASNIGGLREAVVHGENGILVSPNDPHELSEAIAFLLEKPEVATRMGESGYRRFTENYSPDAVVPRIIEMYESLT